jgi:hypothetical protein
MVQDSRPAVASQTLDAVAREIATTLGEARVALEAHVEQPGNAQLMQRCESELRQVQGVLRVLEIHGAALLAEEMCQVAQYLQSRANERKNQDEALEALMRAMVQLPSYLERVIAGGRDLALVLLPLLNDMRAVRGSALLSEGTLLLLNLKSDRQAAPLAQVPGEVEVTVPHWARRLRARFQVGLIGWIRGERIDQNAWRPPSRSSSCGGLLVPSSRHCASTAWTVACRSNACWAWGIARSAASMKKARRAMRSPRRSSCSTTCCITSPAPAARVRGSQPCAPPSASVSCCPSTRASSRSVRTSPRRP